MKKAREVGRETDTGRQTEWEKQKAEINALQNTKWNMASIPADSIRIGIRKMPDHLKYLSLQVNMAAPVTRKCKNDFRGEG